ncbi:MAG: hypothetical protein Q8R53_01950 [Nanoarchaeota archaeon]|nr:hypothetical protein [Nanoarchaeota archaeon]
MHKLQTPEDVYRALAAQGVYEEAHFDKDEVKKVLLMAREDYEFGKSLRKMKNPSWRVIFNIHYDAFRELCDQLLRFERQKSSNHQGVFAVIMLHYKDLEFDWDFLESIRLVRNKNKYQGLDVSQQTWKSVEMQFDLYISAVKNEIEKRLKAV